MKGEDMTVEEIGQVGLTVADLARAKEFYGDVLGMSFLFEVGTMAFFRCGSARLMLGLAEAGQEVSLGGTILYYRVAGIEGACEELKGKGIELLQGAHVVAKMPDHVLWMAFLRDPDGNVVGLMEEVR